MDLYVDGYLAQMFCPEGVESYLPRLLAMETPPMRLNVTQEWPQAFFITSPMQNTRPCLSINGKPAWLLDYAIRLVGTVVPQRIWSPRCFSGANLLLRMPIFFAHNDRVNLGLPLIKAVAGDCEALLDASAPAPVGDCSTTYIRINVRIL